MSGEIYTLPGFFPPFSNKNVKYPNELGAPVSKPGEQIIRTDTWQPCLPSSLSNI